MFDIQNDLAKRTICVSMSGFMDEEEMKEFVEAYKKVADTYNGAKHLVLADMRGFKPTSPSAAQIMGEGIAYDRQRGVAGCVHLSDDVIARLQANRVARGNSPDDELTIDVVSMAEAERVLEEKVSEHFPFSVPQ